MAAISEKGATLQPKGNSSEDVIVKNSLYKADKVASKLSFIFERIYVMRIKDIASQIVEMEKVPTYLIIRRFFLP